MSGSALMLRDFYGFCGLWTELGSGFGLGVVEANYFKLKIFILTCLMYA